MMARTIGIMDVPPYGGGGMDAWPFWDMRSYATFADAIAAIGVTNATLAIDTILPVTVNITVPANVTLRFVQGGSLAIANAVTVIMNGHVEAGLYQIFSWTGTGKVVFGAGAVEAVYPEWWGDVTTAGLTMQKAFDSLPSGGGTITITKQVKLSATLIALSKTVEIRGVSVYGSDLYYEGTGGVIQLSDSGHSILRNFCISKCGSDNRGIILDGVFRPLLENLSLRNGSLELLDTQLYPTYSGVLWGSFYNIEAMNVYLYSVGAHSGVSMNKFFGVNTVGTVAQKCGLWIKAGGNTENNMFIGCDFSYADGANAIGIDIEAGCIANVFINTYVESNTIAIRNAATGTRFIGGKTGGNPILPIVMFEEFTAEAILFPKIHNYPIVSIVKNGGMETWAVGLPQDWTATATVASQSDDILKVRGGMYSVKLISTAAYSYLRQSITPFLVNSTERIRRDGFTIRGWFRADAGNPNPSIVRLASYNGAGVEYSHRDVTIRKEDKMGEYVLYMVPGDMSAGETEIRLELYPNGTANADTTSVLYADDIVGYPGKDIGVYSDL